MVDILLPKLGFSMEEGTVVEWFVDNGGSVTAGQPLFSVEGEKAVQEIEAPASGTLTIIARAGEEHPVGAVIAQIS